MEYIHLIYILIFSGTFGTPVEQMSQFRANSERYLNNPTSTFEWAHCDKISSPFNISYLNIQPDPIILGQDLHFSFDASLSENVGNGTLVELDADIKMLIDGSYEEICYFIGNKLCYKPDICKDPGYPCPLFKGNLSETNTYNTTKPPFLIAGLFEATLVLRENGRDLVCVKLWFSIQS